MCDSGSIMLNKSQTFCDGHVSYTVETLQVRFISAQVGWHHFEGLHGHIRECEIKAEHQNEISGKTCLWFDKWNMFFLFISQEKQNTRFNAIHWHPELNFKPSICFLDDCGLTTQGV